MTRLEASLTIVAIIVGAEAVFMAADSRTTDSVTGEALDAPSRKLHHLDGPLIAAAAGFGPSVTRDLLPMVETAMKTGGVSGDLAFVEAWVVRLGAPLFALGRLLREAVGQDPADAQLIVAFGGVREDGPQVRVHRFDTGVTEVMTPGMIAAFGSDTAAMQEVAHELAEAHLREREIQADVWAFELCKAAAAAFPSTVGFPLNFMIVGPTAGAASVIEAPARRLEARPEFRVRF